MDLQFVDTETSLGYMGALERHIEQHGIPVALYSDRHSIFRFNPMKNLPTDAQTQFAMALEQLGIEGIQANSPQAKGRVERANQWLPTFIQDFNRRFAVSPSDTIDAHSRYEGDTHSLRGTLSLQTTRRLSKNLSCHFENELLQVKSDNFGLALRGAYVTVHQHVNGQLELRSNGKTLPFERMAKVVKQSKQVLCVDGKGVNARVEQGLRKRVTSMLAASTISKINHLENRCAP